jgi:hypothetical protein
VLVYSAWRSTSVAHALHLASNIVFLVKAHAAAGD